MNPKSVKKHICEELAHGKPIQLILSPPHPKIEVPIDKRVKDGLTKEIPDPDWTKPDLPDWNIVVQWLKDDEVFRNDYDHAMMYGAKYMADEMMILKDQVISDPRNASAYKVAMEMIKTSAMWRDPKYSERTIQEVRNTTPQDAEVIAARIKQLKDELQKELGLDMKDMGAVETVDVVAAPLLKKPPTAKQVSHYEKMRAAKAVRDAQRKKA